MICKVLLAILAITVHVSVGFTASSPWATRLSASSIQNSMELGARPKKRRRRRQSTPEEPTGGDSADMSQPMDSASDELPEFDLPEEMDDSPKPMMSSSASSSSSNPLEEPITASMMGNADMPTTGINQLLADRSLEKTVNFDDPNSNNEDLPDLLSMSKGEPAIGKKRARREARVAQALAAKGGEEEEGESILSKLPIDLTDSEGKVAPLKIIENATWLGIFLLVGWEIYINSPLFDRAAPMAPVVY